MPMPGSSRWCPTPEQLMILEEIYKGGVRTPNASQIQNITCHLSRYGKIEGKNVFYWFQNHKARDRQKLRKRQFLVTKLQLQQQQQQQQQQHMNYDHHRHLLFPSTSPLIDSHDQGNGVVVDASSTQLKQSRWGSGEIRPNICEEKCTRTRKSDYDDNWMMMRMGANHPSCCNRSSAPPKTLQLFPTTSNTLI